MRASVGEWTTTCVHLVPISICPDSSRVIGSNQEVSQRSPIASKSSSLSASTVKPNDSRGVGTSVHSASGPNRKYASHTTASENTRSQCCLGSDRTIYRFNQKAIPSSRLRVSGSMVWSDSRYVSRSGRTSHRAATPFWARTSSIGRNPVWSMVPVPCGAGRRLRVARTIDQATCRGLGPFKRDTRPVLPRGSVWEGHR